MNKILPSAGWCLVELIKSENETKEGIYIPDSVSVGEESLKAKVLEIGRPKIGEGGVMEYPPAFGDHKLEKRDVVIFQRHSQREVSKPGEESNIAFINFSSILGIELPEVK